MFVSDECLRWKPENVGLSPWLNPGFLPEVVRPDTVNQAIELEAFHPDPEYQGGIALHTLCPVRALRAYVDRTAGAGPY